MKNTIKTGIMAICLLWAYSAAELQFVPYVVHTEKGNKWGKTAIADFDNDGNMDFAAGIHKGAAFWYRNPGTLSGKWEQHDIDPNNGGCVGGDAADVDGDGLADWISHGMWYRNNKENPGSFEKFSFAGRTIMCHDVVAVDIDQDGLIDAMNHEIKWWKNPGKDKVTGTWEVHEVAKVNYHGGIAPHGWGDIDGDGDIDVVGINNWWKNLDGKGTQWEKKDYSAWSKRDQNRIWVADIDGDGDQDIALGEGDFGGGRGAWVKNLDGKGGEWETIPLDMGGIKGDFHSIGAHDYDNDGDIDICLPKNGGGEGNEWLIFENMDGKGTFERREVYKGFGGHETVWGDLDGDGDIDMVSKCWCNPTNIVVLENKLDLPAPAAPEGISTTVTPENQIEISWTPPAGSKVKLAYIVYRNDVVLDTVTTAKYLDTTTTAGLSYNYSISALIGKKEGEKSVPHQFSATYPMVKLKKRISFSARTSNGPSGATLIVESSAIGENIVEIFNLHGSRLIKHGIPGQVRSIIPLQGFEKGVYIVRLSAVPETVTQKIFLLQ